MVLNTRTKLIYTTKTLWRNCHSSSLSLLVVSSYPFLSFSVPHMDEIHLPLPHGSFLFLASSFLTRRKGQGNFFGHQVIIFTICSKITYTFSLSSLSVSAYSFLFLISKQIICKSTTNAYSFIDANLILFSNLRKRSLKAIKS